MDKGKTTKILSGGAYIGKDGKRHEWRKIHGYNPKKITDDNWMEYGMPADDETNETNETKNMNKKLIRLTEQDLHRIVKESVNRIISEARYAWDLTNDGVDEFDMESGYPTRDTASRYDAVRDNDYIGRKIVKARNMGLDRASGNGWRQDAKNTNKFAQDDPIWRDARDYVNHGKYYPLGYATRTSLDDYAEDDLNAFNKAERKRNAAADRRWMKSADSRPLYGKNSPNNDIPR